jgi:hypothetical protein
MGSEIGILKESFDFYGEEVRSHLEGEVSGLNT